MLKNQSEQLSSGLYRPSRWSPTMKQVCIGFLVLASVACGGTEDKGTAGDCPAPCKAPQLRGHTFLLQSAQGFAPLAGSTPSISFYDGRLGLGANCNTVEGEFALLDARLVVTDVGVTLAGCSAAEHEQDQWLASFITSSPRVALDADILTLSGTGATLVFVDRETADPDRPLVSTPWTIDTFLANDALQQLAGPQDASLLFAQDGSLSFQTGCNSGTGTYTVTGGQLMLGNIATTDRACAGPPAAAEQQMLEVLTGEAPVSFKIAGRRLTITRGKIGLGASAPKS
jgi:heat shock protein HslJ